MKRIALILILLIVASAVFSDYVNIGHATKWAVVNHYTILVYYNNVPLAMIEFADYENITEYSEIYILDDYIYDGAQIRIDHRIVQIKKVIKLS